MNKSFRSIWNTSKQAYVAAAETVSAKGKPSSGTKVAAALSALFGGLLSLSANAQTAPPPGTLPTAGQVSAGQASISQSGANMVIQQSSQRAAINWQTFNVGSNAQVQFNQPSASSVTLNRVMSSDPSQIFGRISANGQVILTNPSGVYFGPSARVDVGGLIATTHGISNADFMAGGNRFERNGSTASVVNEGELKASLGGYIALLGPEVRNQGAVIAQMGTVAMASGEAVDLRFDNNNRLTSLRVDPSQIQALVDNRHAVQAPGGLVIISAQSLDRLVGGVVQNSGAIEANSLTSKGGRIVLEANRIQLNNSSRLDASGATGGGTVLVGGDWQGSGDLHQATTVIMEAGASINASATVQGDGGKVVLWSDVSQTDSVTTVQGRITARAGIHGGSGGQVETSGHALNTDGIQVDVGATQGAGGRWLLDPTDSTITQAVADSYASTLNAGGNVENLASSITWNTGVSLLKNAGGDATLTLRTSGTGSSSAVGVPDILLNNASITSTNGKLNLVLWMSPWAGTIKLDGTTIASNGGHVWMGGGSGSTTWNALTVGDAPAYSWWPNRPPIHITGSSISTGTGDITINGYSWASTYTNGVAAGQGTQNYGVWITGNSTLSTTSGSVNVTGTSNGTVLNGMGVLLGNTSGSGNSVSINTDSGNINISGAAANDATSSGSFDGLTLASYGNTDQVIIKSISGAITLSGTRGSYGTSDTSASGLRLQSDNTSSTSGIQVVSQTGTIALSGSNAREASNQKLNAIRFTTADAADRIMIGYDGTNAYSGDITITGNSLQQYNDNAGTNTISVRSTGGLTIQSNGPAFSYLRLGTGTGTLTFNDDWNFGASLTNFTLGKTTNTLDLTLGNALSVAGSVAIYGGNINVNGNITETSTNASTLTLKATGDISLAASKTISSTNNKLNVTFWSDSDASGQGYIGMGANSTIATNGGDIVMGGGAASNSLPGGYANNTSATGLNGIDLNQANLDARVGSTLDANAGSITLRGSSSYGTSGTSASPNYARGIFLYSSKLYGNNLTLDGKTTSTNLTNLVTYGISSNGNSAPNNTQLNAYGDITLTGTAANPGTTAIQNTTQNAIRWGVNHTMASANGNITINATGQLDWFSTQTLTLATGKALFYNSNYNGIWSNVVAGAGGLTKQGGGTLTLSAANTYTGATTISAGTLALDSTGTIATSSEIANSGNFSIGANKTIDSMTGTGTTNVGSYTLTIGNASNTSATYGGVISGTGGINKAGTGTLTLSGIHTYTGATTISAGTLALDSTGTIATSSGVANSGNFSMGANKTIDSMTGTGTTNVGSYTLTIGDASNTSATYGGVISGTGGINKAGTGTLTLSGIHTYTGATTISAGTLALDSTGTIATSSGVANSGNFSIGADKTIDSMTGTGATNVGSYTLTIGDASNTNATYGGVISGTGGITKAGTGTLTFSGANTYSGNTTVSTGTLKAAHNSALGSATGNTEVSPNATLAVADGVSIAEPLQLSGIGASSAGALNLQGTSTSSGAITLAADTTIVGSTGTQTLSGSVDGAYALTITSAGGWTQSGVVGAAHALTNFTLTSANAATLGSISAQGSLNIATLSGDLTLNNALSTTNNSSSAIVLNAGKNTNALTATGGNIIASGGSVSTGAGGRATLYSGSIASSTGLTSLIGSGSGRFRYASDETTSNFTAALGTGSFVVYRERPTANITSMALSMSYGNALPSVTTTGTVNGDASNYSIASAAYSSSNQLKASTTPYTITSTLGSLGYNATGTSSGTLTVNAKALTMTGLSVPSSKVYDGTTSAVVSGTGNLQTDITAGTGTSSDGKPYTGDLVSIAGTAIGTYNSKNASSANTVTFSGLSLTGADASNYSLTIQAPASATVTPKALTISGLSSQDKVYDGTTAAVVVGTASLQTAIATGTGSSNDGKSYAIDSINLSGTAIGNFNSKDVANANQVTFNGLSLTGADSGNYTLTPHALDTTARITKAPLTVRVNDDAKFVVESDRAGYNGLSYSGFVNGETTSVLGGSATITRSNASTNTAGTYPSVLDATGLTSDNYTITYQPGKYTIVPSNQLLVEVMGASTSYGTSTQYTINAIKYEHNGVVYRLGNGGIAGSSVSINSNNMVSIQDGSGGTAIFTLAPTSGVLSHANQLAVGNYQLGTTGTVTTNSANFSNTITVVGAHQVNTKGVTASASNVSKVYDGSANMTGVSLNLSTLEMNDVVTINGAGAFSGKDVGTNQNYALSNLRLTGPDAGNYHLIGGTSFSGSNGVITAASLTVTANNASKTYDATAFSGGNGVNYSGFVGGESASVLGGTLVYGGTSQGATNAGSYTITPSGLSSNNYTISYADGTLTINPAAVVATPIQGTLQGTVRKVYDGSDVATLAPANYLLTGWIGTDGASVTKTRGTYDNAHAGTGKTVTVALAGSDYSATGNTQLSNYTLPTSISGAVGSISRAPLVISGIAAADKVYDGNSVATISTSGVTAAVLQAGGLVAGDDVRVSATGHFRNASNTADDASVGTAKWVALLSTYSGSDVGNYVITDQATTTASIQPAMNRTAQVVATVQNSVPLSTPPGVALPSTPPPPLISPTVATSMSISATSSASPATSTTAAGTTSGAGITIDLRQATNTNISTFMMAAVSLPKGTSTIGTGFNFELPEAVHALAKDKTLIQASQTNGSPLPLWLNFDARALRFDAKAVPDGAFPLQLILNLGDQRVLVTISERAD